MFYNGLPRSTVQKVRENAICSLSPPPECKQRQDWVLPPERMGDDAPDHASRVH